MERLYLFLFPTLLSPFTTPILQSVNFCVIPLPISADYLLERGSQRLRRSRPSGPQLRGVSSDRPASREERLRHSRQSGILPSLQTPSQICLDLRADEGQSLVEFALTLPLILLAVTGILVFGVAFNNFMMLTDATAIGARQLAISRGQTLDPCATLVSAVSSAAPMLKPANMTFNISLNGTRYTSTSCSGSTTYGAPANMVLGSTVIVTVTYPCSLSLFRDLISPLFLLTAQTSELMQ